MQKKILISLGFAAVIGLTTVQAMANSTVYTDELGRLHFLGKDPGAKTLQKIDDYGNPETKDVTDINYTYGLRNIDKYDAERYNVTETKNVSNTTGTAKGTFSATKGAMDASNPYVYGGTNVESKTTTETTTSNKKAKDPLNIDDGNTGKHFWQIW